MPTDATCLKSFGVENRSHYTVSFVTLIQVRSGQLMFHLEFLICAGNSRGEPGSESDVFWEGKLFAASALVSTLVTHHTDTFFVPGISVKTEWIEPELMPMELVISRIVRFLSFKAVR